MKGPGLLLVFTSCWHLLLTGQPNCKVYELAGDTACFNACEHALKAIEFYQGARQSQMHFDSAIALCPNFAYAHAEKSVPYLKRGDFINWRKMIDRAVELDPTSYLPSRASAFYQFLRDYKNAIADLDRLDSLINYDLGYTTNGRYHLEVIRALCHRGLGDIDTAVTLLKDHLSRQNIEPGLYDYLHLSAMLIEKEAYEAAVHALDKQKLINGELAEVEYFYAVARGHLGHFEQEKNHLFVAEQLLVKGQQMYDSYTHPPDQISIEDIETALEKNRTALEKKSLNR